MSTIDGVEMVEGDRILVKKAAVWYKRWWARLLRKPIPEAPVENGVYVVSTGSWKK